MTVAFSFPLIFLFCLCLLLSRYVYLHKLTKRYVANKIQRLPPGTRGWPIVGESLDYLSNVRRGVPENFVTERRNKYSSKVFRTSLVGQPVVVFCGAEANKFLFSNEKKLVQVWWPSTLDKIFPKSNNDSTSENSRRLRKLLPLILKADSLRDYVAVMDAVMKQHLQTDWNCERVKVAILSKKYTLMLGCKIFLSIDDLKKINAFNKSIEDIAKGLHALPLNFPGTALHRAISASKDLRKEIEGMIEQRKIDLLEKSPSVKKDIMTHLLQTTDENGQFFTGSDIASHIVALLMGGYKTVHSTITILMKYLAELPDVYNAVLREQKEIAESKGSNELLSWEDLRKMKYSWNAACEVLRLMPPGIGSFKEVITEFTYGEYLIPKGWKIHWILNATHKNPEYYAEPEKFDPTRFEGNGPAPYTFIPFGGGPRMCPGNEYARLAILVFLHNVVIKYKWEKIIPDENILHDPVPRPAQGFPVRLLAHNP